MSRSLFILVVGAAAVGLMAAVSPTNAQDPNLEVIDNFNSGAEGWQIYDYDGGGSGNVFYPVTWQNSGGVGNSGYVWGDHSRWRIDTPENPDSILSFIIYRNWVGEQSLDLRDAELSFYLRGDNLDLKGASVYFWALESNDYGHRWHLTSQPLQVTEGGWGEKQTVILENDPALWHRSWTRSPLVPGTLDDILGDVESYGFSFVGFPTGVEVTGTFAMDELELRAVSVVPQPGIFRWQTTGLGNWNAGSNWDWSTAPNSNAVTAVFGDEVSAATTVVTNSAVTVQAVEFDSPSSYVIGGAGSVTLSADMGHAGIDVLRGSHQFQAVVNLNSETDVDVATGASLAFNNALNIGAHDLNKTGAGTLQINNALNTSGGTVNGLAGLISGSGLVSDDLNNSGAKVAPGTGTGTLSVGGDYAQQAGATLEVELGGTTVGSEYDQLSVAGTAALDGALNVSLINLGDGVFAPQIHDTFTILAATGGRAGVFTTTPSELPALAAGLAWQINYGANDVELAIVAVPEPSACFLLHLGALIFLLSRKRLRPS